MKMRIPAVILLLTCFIPDLIRPAFCFETEALIRLKNAGISESIIETVLNEKIFETCALTADDIIQLKQSGFSDTLISAYIWRQSFLGRERNKVYTNTRGDSAKVTRVSIEDLERLKEDGFSDDIIKGIIASQAEASRIQEQNQILEMFENMELFLEAGKSGHESLE